MLMLGSDVSLSVCSSVRLKEKSGVKWIWDMFGMITSWNVRLGAKKAHIVAFLSWLFLADSIKTL